MADTSKSRRRQLDALLRRRLESPSKHSAPPSLSRRDGDGPWPLSRAQERLWLLQRLAPTSAAYNMPGLVEWRGPLDAGALHAALSALVRRHEILRARFSATPDGPRQQVDAAPPRFRTRVDLDALAPLERAAEALRLARRDAARPFDLERGPLLRAVLLRTDPATADLALTLHHIAADGWSLGVLEHELGEFYTAILAGRPARLPEFPTSAVDLAVDERAREAAADPVLAARLEPWRRQLEGLESLEMPLDRPRPASRRGVGARIDRALLDRAALDRLDALARDRRATRVAVLLAAWQGFLGRWCDQDDFAVGSPVAGRERRETQGMVGFLVDNLVLRARLQGNPSFSELVERARDALFAADEHHVSFDRLNEALRPERGGGSPFFQTMLAIEESFAPRRLKGGLQVRVRRLDNQTSKFDLTLFLTPSAEGLAGSLEIDRELFDLESGKLLLDAFAAFLADAVAHPERSLAEIALQDDAERRRVATWSENPAPYPRERTLDQLFAEVAEASPDAVAVTFRDRQVTYAELRRRATRLARTLRRHGVGAESAVALLTERSPEMVVATLAVLEAGGFYVPLDPAYPVERLRYLLEDSGAGIVLVDGSVDELVDRLEFDPARLLRLDALDDDAALPADDVPFPARDASRLAYVMYTSGSTGRPKGVAVPHRAVVRLAYNADVFRLDAEEAVLQFAPTAFDAATLEIWAPLLRGARLVLFPERRASLDALGEVLERERITTLWLTAGLFRQMVDLHVERLGGLRRLLAGGEALPVAQVRRALDALPRTTLINGYGPTENTTFTTCHAMTVDPGPILSVPIGRPISNSRAHVLDRRLRPLPTGMAGQLAAAGDGLARGYLGRPALTAERFIPDPLVPDPLVPDPLDREAPGGRLYLTGDRARWRHGGTLEFLGRLDRQIKLRGHRIEPGEIENALTEIEDIRQAAVLLVEVRPGDPRLVAYLVTRGEFDLDALRRELAASLPEAMIPSAFVPLDALPLTANGKLDRAALPAPRWGADAASYVAPRSELEAEVAGLFAELLGAARVGVDDDFFALGGHSLLATLLTARLSKAFGVDVELRRVFETPTVAGVAAAVEAVLETTGRRDALPPIERIPRGEDLPASFAQERLWLLDQLQPGSATYNIVAAAELDGPLDAAALNAAFNAMARRHETLRTAVAARADQPPTQRVAARVDIAPARVDLEALAAVDRQRVAERICRVDAARPFDLAAPPLLRPLLLRVDAERHRLYLALHHIIADGWSMAVLLGELDTLYRLARRPGAPPPPLAVQYADFAARQRAHLRGERLARQIEHWRERLAGLPVLELPTDMPRPAQRRERGRTLPVRFSRPLVEALEGRARERGATLFMVFLAGFVALLERWSGARDLAVGSPIAGRRAAELEGLIGLFVNTLVLRLDLGGEPSFAELIDRARDTALAAYAHQDVPFEKLVEELRPERRLSTTPLFQVLLALQNAPRREFELPGVTHRPLHLDTGTAKFDLSLLVEQRGGGLEGHLEYDRDLFHETTARRFLRRLETLLEGAGEEPSRRLSELDLLRPAERFQLLEWSAAMEHDRALDPPSEAPLATLPEMLAARVAETPDAVALVAVGDEIERVLTYGGFHARVRRLAGRLRARGARTGTVVGVALEPSLELHEAIFAVFEAGGVYLPLDIAFPEERLAFLVDDADVRLVLTREAHAARLPESVELLFVDRTSSSDDLGGALAPDPPTTELTPDHLAYLSYTSGSTGRPKGVAIRPAERAPMMDWSRRYFELGGSTRVVRSLSHTFDFGLWEILVTLLSGGEVCFAEGDAFNDPARVARIALERRATLLNATPSFAQTLAVAAPGELSTVRALNLAGEALSAEICDALFPMLPEDGVLHNSYGPTETTVLSSTFRVGTRGARRDGGRASTSIGRRCGVHLDYIVDRRLRLQPIGVPGQLAIGGEGVMAGYLGRPGLTAEKVVPNPFAGRFQAGRGGGRIYLTGDLARRDPRGEIDFLGRLDHQVKIRGLRIELGEIEEALRRLDGIDGALVEARELGAAGLSLIAWVVRGGAASDPAPDAAALRAALGLTLPQYMLPSVIVDLDAWPLLPSGKIDRRALPTPTPDGETGRAPSTPTEEALCRLWGEVLEIDEVGAESDFFALGGHSLLAARLAARVRQRFGVNLPLRRIFDAPTPAALARSVDAARGAASQPVEAIPLVRRTVLDGPVSAPLSPAQERLWLLDQIEDDPTLYSMPTALRMRGEVDGAALFAAFRAAARRHEILRTTFAEGRQMIHPELSPEARRVDLGALTPIDRERVADDLARRDARRPFVLAAGPLVRATLVRRAPSDHDLLLNLHHLVTDGWSMGVLLREVGALYAAALDERAARLPPLVLQYVDYAVWQRRRLASGEGERRLDFWRRELEGVPELELPTDRPGGRRVSSRGGVVALHLDAALVEGLERIARDRRATLFAVLAAALQAFLGRLSGQLDFAVGTVLAGRSRRELEELIGFFVQTVALRADLSGGPRFAELVDRARERLLDADAHQDVPLQEVTAALAARRGSAPLFKTLLVLENMPLGRLELPSRGDAPTLLEPMVPVSGTAKFDLGVLLEPRADGSLGGWWSYRSELFDRATVLRLTRSFAALLHDAAEAPTRPLGELAMLDSAARQQLLGELYEQPDFPVPTTLHAIVEATAARVPERVAVLDDELVAGGAVHQLTYGALDARAEAFARRLRALGAGPEALVALSLERSPSQIVAILGILKSGAAYLPLDPSNPPERVAAILEQADPRVLVTDAAGRERFAGLDIPSIHPEDGETAEDSETAEDGEMASVHADHPAYVLFTSGSTGRPKGIAVTHRAAATRIAWVACGDSDEATRWPVKTSTGFDVSIGEIFGPLAAGGMILLARRGEQRDSAYLKDLMARERVTDSSFQTSLLQLLLSDPRLPALPALRRVLTGAEVVPPDLVARFRALLPGTRLENRYGPTEATISMTSWVCPPEGWRDDAVPIGRPFSKAEVLIVDRWGRPAPLGVPGELAIGGPILARGYWNHPARTAESFTPHPSSGRAGERIYRSGDLARLLHDGQIAFLGRIDHQVKIRGFRVELGEIDSVLTRHPRVEQAVTIDLPDGSTRRLAAYVVARPDDGLAPDDLIRELREWVGARLPDYMVPASLQRLDALPLNTNSKVDRKALPAPTWGDGERTYTPAATPLEERLATIWSELLGIERIGREDDFFSLGGHSLLATRLASRLREDLRLDVPLRLLFETPILADLARALDGAPADDVDVAPIPHRCDTDTNTDSGEPPIVSFAQERLWLLDQLEPGDPTYNLPAAVRLDGDLDVAALDAALDAVTARHESLRTTFAVSSHGEPRQIIAPPRREAPAKIDLSHVVDVDAEARRLAHLDARRPFDLARGPLRRALLVKLEARHHLLLLNLHHIITDGWSTGVLVRELATLYRAAHEREPGASIPSPLPPLAIQYADFAVWQRGRLQGEDLERQLAFWREQLGDAPTVLDLPTDRPRPPVVGLRGRRLPVAWSAERVGALKRLGEDGEATLFMVLLTAFTALLHRLSGTRDLVVGTPIAGRERAEIEPLIGFFVNTLAIRSRRAAADRFVDHLAHLRAATLDAYAHQELPFEKLVAELSPRRRRDHTPIFQVMLAHQAAAPPLDLPGLVIEPVEFESGTAKFDLTLTVAEQRDGGLRGILGYRLDLFDDTTIRRLCSHLDHLLDAALHDPARPLDTLDLLGRAETQQLLTEWNDLPEPAPRDEARRDLYDLVARHVDVRPDAVALIAEAEDGAVRAISYGEFGRRVQARAAELAVAGVGRETRVGLIAERSPEAIVDLLSILAAGGVVVPLDPSYPAERLRFMEEDSGVVGIFGAGAGAANATPGAPIHPDQLAYVIYTSGSTGKPKGVAVPHRGALNTLAAARELFGVTPESRCLQMASLGFDASVLEIWNALGSALVMPHRERLRSDPAGVLGRHRVTTLVVVPSFLAALGDHELSTVTALSIGGEACPGPLAAHWAKRARLLNLYAPTELSIFTTAFVHPPERLFPGAPPLGRPIPGSRVVLLDRRAMPVPIGAAGEICGGGEGVARGYLGLPGRTAESFIPDAWSGASGVRLYRSGDLARRLADGTLDFLGRLDHQVKVRGVRVELGEIESALRADAAVADAAVLLRADLPGGAGLVAYLCPAEQDLDLRALRARLAERLPDAMVPSLFVPFGALPHTATGKIDRKALERAPRPDALDGAGFTPPEGPIEERLATIWAEVLGVERIGRTDNFFELGGDSLKATLLTHRLQRELGEYVYVVALFDAPDLAALADYLRTHYAEPVARWCGESLDPATPDENSPPVEPPIEEQDLDALRRLITPLRARPATARRNPRAVFVLSPPRSGSTLLRVLLAGHPKLFAPPELELLSFVDLAEREAAFGERFAFWLEGLIRAVMELEGRGADDAQAELRRMTGDGATALETFERLQVGLNGRLLVDKTPAYALDPAILQRMEDDFEAPLYLHLVRHPYGMIRSFEKARLEQVFFRHPHTVPRRRLAELIWTVCHRNILAFLDQVPEERRLRVRFEEMVRQPRRVLGGVADFLGLDFHDAMLDPYDDASARMTDGIHPLSKMVGDVKFHEHRGIDPKIADSWRRDIREDFLGPPTWDVAARLGLDGERAEAAQKTEMVRAERVERAGYITAPLSFAQERIWFSHRLEGPSSSFHIPGLVRLHGRPDVAALRAALARITARHEVLRSVYWTDDDGRSWQRILPALETPLPLVDLGRLPSAERERLGLRLCKRRARRLFDLEHGPLLHTALIRLTPDDHLLVFSLHHIAGDGWSMTVLFRELGALYTAAVAGGTARLPRLAVQYADFAAHQARELESAEHDRQLAWWAEQLRGAPAALDLPTDRPRPLTQAKRGRLHTSRLPAALVGKLRALGAEQGATLFMTLLTGFYVVLAHHSGRRDLLVGTPIAGRSLRETRDLLGIFLGFLVLRGDLTGAPSFREALVRVRKMTGEAQSRPDVPFEHLLEALQPPRDLSRPSIFQVLFNMLNLPSGRVELPGLELEPIELGGASAKLDLTLYLAENRENGDVDLQWAYSADLFDPERIAVLAEHYHLALERAAADPERPVDAFDLPTPAPSAEPPNRLGKLGEHPPTRVRDAAAWHEHAAAHPPRDAVERRLAEIWSELLEHPVGVDDEFFDSGGTSLLLTRLLARIEKRFGRSVKLVDVMRRATVEGIAELLR